jgi:four helix bundle protein
MAEVPSGPIKSFRDLLVWRKGMDLMVECYKITKRLPASERFGLTAQIRRAAVSIPANIAEGHARRHTGDFVHHLSIAMGSVAELETHLEATVRLEFLPSQDVVPLLERSAEISRMLFSLISKLQARRGKP